MRPVARASPPVNLSLVAQAGGLANLGKMPMPHFAHIATGSVLTGEQRSYIIQ